jgi:hypothetical protein
MATDIGTKIRNLRITNKLTQPEQPKVKPQANHII